MKRLKNKSGESIAETLVAVLILALAFLMMTGAVTAAARVNARVKNVGEDPETESSAPVDTGKQATVVVALDEGRTSTLTPEIFQVNDNYYYECD